MSELGSALLGIPFVLVVGGIWLLFFMVILGWPLLVWSAVRSLRQIARELERANDYREHYDHGKKPTAIGM